MPRTWLSLGVLLVVTAVAFAEPPSDQRVMANANVPPRACDVTILKNCEVNGLILPLPGLGFLHVPVQVWACTAYHTPPNAPAGARPMRQTVRLITLAE